jgi:hypothetical protein
MYTRGKLGASICRASRVAIRSRNLPFVHSSIAWATASGCIGKIFPANLIWFLPVVGRWFSSMDVTGISMIVNMGELSLLLIPCFGPPKEKAIKCETYESTMHFFPWVGKSSQFGSVKQKTLKSFQIELKNSWKEIDGEPLPPSS